MNQLATNTLSSRPIIFMVSLVLDSFSSTMPLMSRDTGNSMHMAITSDMSGPRLE